MKISIVTPVFNNEKTIEKTIKSILKQKDKDLEYIIIDGKSTDRTMDVVKKYIDDIDVVVSEKDYGISDAYNKGIKLSSGDIIGIVAADDQLIDGTIDQINQLYDGSDIISGNVVEYNGKRYKKILSNSELKLLRYMTSICHPATFIRKDAYEKYGLYSLDYKCAIDRELFLRFYLSGASFQFVNSYFSFMSSGGISNSNPCKYAFIEDKIISQKYGLSMLEANIFYYKSVAKYYIGVSVKFILKSLNLLNWQMNKFQKKGFYMSFKEIEELKKLIIL